MTEQEITEKLNQHDEVLRQQAEDIGVLKNASKDAHNKIDAVTRSVDALAEKVNNMAKKLTNIERRMAINDGRDAWTHRLVCIGLGLSLVTFVYIVASNHANAKELSVWYRVNT